MAGWNVTALGSAGSDIEPTVIVNFGVAKYAFNASEGMGRAWMQSQHSFRKLRGLFLTGANIQRCGGVPGMLMLCADASLSKLDIIGPYGLMHYLATMRGYTYRSTMVVKAIEAPTAPPASLSGTPPPVYKDEHITVYTIPVYPTRTADDADKADTDDTPTLKRKRSPSPPTRITRPLTRDGAMTVDSAAPVARPLVTRARSPSFNPRALRGADADEWRRLVLQDMFPMRTQPPEEPGRGKKQKRKAAEEKKKERDSDSEGGARSSISPDKRYSRLPPLGLTDKDVTRAGLPQLCYLIVGPSVRGKFDVKQAEALGIPNGPIRARLTRGETVTFTVPDGNGGEIERTVKAEECVGPTELPQAVLILDIPTPDHIPSLLESFTQSPFLSRYRSRAEADRKENPVHTVYHYCGEGVLEDERYRTFLDGFSPDVHHIISSREHTPDRITFVHAASLQRKLNHIDRAMFPIPKHSLEPERPFSSVNGLPATAVLSHHDIQVSVRPSRPPALDALAKPDEFNSTAGGPDLSQSVLEKIASTQEVLAKHVEAEHVPGDDVTVTLTGTGSAIPTRLRNVSGTLIQVPKWGNILLDCGEGTWGQLVRCFGPDPRRTEGVWDALRALKCIFVSHMHGDHHMGLTRILTARKMMNPPPTEPLYVVGLRPHLIYLLERQEIDDLGLNDGPNGVVLVLSDVLNWRPPHGYGKNVKYDEPFMDTETSLQNARAMRQALGLETFTTVDMLHRIRCYGAVLRHTDGWSIAFSADTMPSPNFAKVGQGATLLIHESSMSPNEKKLAAEKAHSTSAQAIDVGRRMRAQKLLLTHFSARYPGMPTRYGGSAGDPLIGIAFDYAHIRLGEMWKLNAYLPVIQQVFGDLGDEDPLEIDLAKLQ